MVDARFVQTMTEPGPQAARPIVSEFRVGTSGWIYPHWRGRFYPERLPTKNWFAFYTQQFNTVEINNTFYRLGELTTFDQWRQAAPAGFLYAVKCHRYVTHQLKLTKFVEPLGRVFERVARLQLHAGPVLYQLPPRWRKNVARLEQFCRGLPPGYTHVFEFRQSDWLAEDVFEVLAAHGASLCIHDAIERHPRRVLGPVAYVRFHGATGRYQGNYSRDQLRRWADWMREAAQQAQVVYAYFNNDAEAHAVRNALELRELLAR